MSKYIVLLFIMYLQVPLSAQIPIKVAITGKNLAESTSESLAGASLQWLNTTEGAIADTSGLGIILPYHHLPHELVVSFVGYISDTLTIIPGQSVYTAELLAEQILHSVEIVSRQSKSFVSTLNPIKTEVIKQGELRKAACCNLAESFQTNASVGISYADAVTGAKEIQMLGLDGVYVQMLTESVPTLRGLSGTFGLSHVPAPWMESISVSKGAPSVRNGYEGITGAISIDYKKPFEADKLYTDIFLNHMGRTELNVISGGKLNDKWSGVLFTNAGFFRTKMDRNDDTFVDEPLYQQYSAMNRWHFQGQKAEAQIGAKFLYEDREAGQLGGHSNEITVHPYLVNIRTTHAEAFLKNGYFFDNKPNQSLGYQIDGSWHKQEGVYGHRLYNGTQGSLFGNMIFQTLLKNTNHGWVSGISGQYDRFRENFEGTDYNKNEWSTGAYTEYTFKHLENVTIELGLRGDYHNIAGFQVTPKVHMRFVPWEEAALRLSAGRGFRTVNIFAENTPLLASSRKLVIEEELQPEIAWNYGISLQQGFDIGNRENTISFDYFRTDFINQVITDVDGGNNTFSIYNLDGRSYSNSFQSELNLEVIRNFNIKVAYKMDDVHATIAGNLMRKPFIPRHTGLLALSYETTNRQWQFDANTALQGQRRLPESFEGSASRYSPVYATLGAQVTYRKNGFEVYLGGENITNYTQKDPIIGWQDPYGDSFDTAQVWGPIVGAMAYGGVRYTLK